MWTKKTRASRKMWISPNQDWAKKTPQDFNDFLFVWWIYSPVYGRLPIDKDFNCGSKYFERWEPQIVVMLIGVLCAIFGLALFDVWKHGNEMKWGDESGSQPRKNTWIMTTYDNHKGLVLFFRVGQKLSPQQWEICHYGTKISGCGTFSGPRRNVGVFFLLALLHQLDCTQRMFLSMGV